MSLSTRTILLTEKPSSGSCQINWNQILFTIFRLIWNHIEFRTVQKQSIDSSCLDNSWHNLSIDNETFFIGPNLADHYAISSLFKKKIDHKPRSFQFRDFSLVSRERFSSNMDVEFSAFSNQRIMLMCTPIIWNVFCLKC